MLIDEDDAVKKRIGILTGGYDNVGGNDTMFLTFLLISLSISTYCKGEMLPIASLFSEVNLLLKYPFKASRHIKETIGLGV